MDRSGTDPGDGTRDVPPPGPARAPADDPAPGPPPVWAGWPLGSRVVLRRRLAEGGFSDALGDLVEADASRAVVRTRRGDVTVDAGDVVAGKRVPPPPERPARPAPR